MENISPIEQAFRAQRAAQIDKAQAIGQQLNIRPVWETADNPHETCGVGYQGKKLVHFRYNHTGYYVKEISLSSSVKEVVRLIDDGEYATSNHVPALLKWLRTLGRQAEAS